MSRRNLRVVDPEADADAALEALHKVEHGIQLRETALKIAIAWQAKNGYRGADKLVQAAAVFLAFMQDGTVPDGK